MYNLTHCLVKKPTSSFLEKKMPVATFVRQSAPSSLANSWNSLVNVCKNQRPCLLHKNYSCKLVYQQDYTCLYSLGYEVFPTFFSCIISKILSKRDCAMCKISTDFPRRPFQNHYHIVYLSRYVKRPLALPKTNTPMNSNLCEKERPEIGRTILIKKLSGNFKIGNRNGWKEQTLHFFTKFELGYYFLFCLNVTKECTLLFASRFSTSFSHSF